MSWLRRMIDWVRGGRDAALMEELEAHRAITQDALERAGLSTADAAAESRRRMGNVTLAREDARDVWIVRWADQLRQHLRHSARGLRREPGFALTAILTIGLGTAATTSVFSVVDAELWRPLPYPDVHALLSVRTAGPAPRNDVDSIGIAELPDWRSSLPAFSSLAASGDRRRRTLQLDHAESVITEEVTANYFTTLGVRPILGRTFADTDARASEVAMLTERGWQRVFSGNPAVVGSVITLDSRARMIVGIVANDDSLGPSPEVFLPIDENAAATSAKPPRPVYGLIGRLADGTTLEVVRQQVQALSDRHGAVDPNRRGHTAAIDDLSTYYSQYNARPLYFFLGASALVLLLTVTNVAGLTLSRALRRAPEFALRGALGGGTHSIAMQLIAEAALVAIPGCAIGLGLSYAAMASLGQVVPDDFLMRGSNIPVDLRVAAFSFGIAVATMLGLVLVPLGLAKRANASAMGSGGRTVNSPSAGRTRVAILTAQLALTVVLLAGAGVFLKSFAALLREPLGFNPDGGWSAHVSLTGPRYEGAAQWRAFGDTLMQQALAIPGVRSAAVATSSPLMSGWLVIATDSTKPKPAPGAQGGVRTIYRAVSADYFDTIGTRIVRGRGLLASDTAGAPDVAVVNEQFARQMFPDGDAVGRQVDLEAQHAAGVRNGTVTIVGVAANIKEISVNEVAFQDIYVPFAQRPASEIELIVHGGAGSPTEMAASLRSAAAKTDSAIPVTSVSSLTRRVEYSFRGARFNLTLVVGFAIVAVLIAAIGIYGAMAYAAAARWREFGVRLALGATPRGLVMRALWQSARVGLIGGGIGLAGALLFAVWLGDALYLVPGSHSGLLFNVKTTDPLALGCAICAVIVLSLIAGAIPARRAGKVNPVSALRAD